MKRNFGFLRSTSSCLTASVLTVSAFAAQGAANFGGAEPAPVGKSVESISQLQIRFPVGITKSALQAEPFKVSCTPAAQGYSSWADNNMLYTYNFKAKTEYGSNKLAGGTKCDVTQVEPLSSADGKAWAVGTINYSVTVAGPNVTQVTPAAGFKGTLRETDPVLFIQFDGPVDRAKFFANRNGYISYMSANAPSEKLPLVPVPADQAEKLFKQFSRNTYSGLEFTDQSYVLATVKQSLIPGAQVSVKIENQASAGNPTVKSDLKFAQDFTVRSQLEAEVHCAKPTAKNANCMPHSPIAVTFNGLIKWSDVKDAYIEYVPFKSTDGKLVRTYPELASDQQSGFWNLLMDKMGEYIPFLAKYSDTVVSSINFDVNVEPQTQAKIVIPNGMRDIDNRMMANVVPEFYVRIGSMSEVIHVPQAISFFEKNTPNLFLPVGIVNLNQKLTIRKSGTDPKIWAPIHDVPSMINLIRAYEARGSYRETPNYITPLDLVATTSTKVEQQMTGQTNRPTFLQFPFGADAQGVGGFYAIEISSPTFEAERSDAKYNRYFNPKYVLAQVTNLAVHLKRGRTHTLAWVTSLTEAQPVAGATVEIYNCLGKPVKSMTTDASGLVSFANQQWATECDKPAKNGYSVFFRPEEFYAVAKLGTDVALTHSSWRSSSSVWSAPGVDYFYSDIDEDAPHYHTVIGVNLVKPGQKVPVEIVAKVPTARGFAEVPAIELPTTARVVSADDRDTFYEFPLTWTNGISNILWNVPSDASVKLGRYYVQLVGQKTGATTSMTTISSSDIEVGEFKVPLMSGLVAFPNQELVKPTAIPVSSIVRYANGIGAKDLGLDLSYYFEPSSVHSKDLPEFSFGNGPVKLNDESETAASSEILPSSSRPATLAGLRSGQDGSLNKDLAAEKVADGRTVSDVLNSLGRPQRLVVRVRYQDQMGEYQTLSQSKEIYNADQYVGTNLVSGSRTEAKLRVAQMNVGGAIVTSQSDLDLKVVRIEAKVIGEELFGGMIKNTVEREVKPVRWNGNCALQDKAVSCSVGALKAGIYAFQANSKSTKQIANTLFKIDAQGRVYGENQYYHFGDDSDNKQLPLALDKKSYKHGERAIVSFPAPFKNCRALVSIERNDVMEASVVNNACQKGFVEIPVDATLAPNAFVSVYAITGRADSATLKIGEVDLGRPTYKLGFANMKVDWDRFQSDVTVKTDKPKYQPGETVQVDVRVAPEAGALQAGTVTLVALEEKILELKQNDTYNLLDALMQPRRDAVQTVTPLERVETVVAENEDSPAGAAAPGARKGGSDGGDGSSKSDFKRKLFDALVSFQPAVPVINGIAHFSFKANDSLTRFKIFAVATDSSQKFGTGDTVYLSEKDTQSYSNIPLVAHAGDSYPVKITVQNNTSQPAQYTAKVTATVKDATGKVIGTKVMTKSVTIGNASSSSIDVGQFATDENATSIQYSIEVNDQNGKLVDAMEPPPQLVLPAVPLAIHDAFIVQVQNGTFTQPLSKEPTALAGKGEIRSSLSKSLVNSALSQIALRMNADMFSDFFIESSFNKAFLRSTQAKPEPLKAVLQSLIGYVDANGFVKYSTQSVRGSVWLTASILNTLQKEPWTMQLLPPALAGKLTSAVSQVLTKSVDPDYVGDSPMQWFRAQVIMAQAAFAFNDPSLISAAKSLNAKFAAELQKNGAAYGQTVDKWATDDLVNYWMLQVYANPQTALQSPIYKQLTGPARLVYTGNMAQLSGSPGYSYYYSDEMIDTAELLYGHSKLKGGPDLARALSVGIVNNSLKSWYVSPTLLAVAEGLKAFGRSYEAAEVTGSAMISVTEEQKSKNVDFTQASSGSLSTPWTGSQATVQITHSGQGQPWVAVEALTAVPLTAPHSQGLAVDKEMKNLTRNSGYQAGDVIEVTLTLHASSAVKHVAMQDPIPAGSNILSDAYGYFSSGQKSYSGYKLYFESLPNGATVVKYQFQLNNPGSFKLPPTRAEALYMPSVYGETPNATMVIQ